MLADAIELHIPFWVLKRVTMPNKSFSFIQNVMYLSKHIIRFTDVNQG